MKRLIIMTVMMPALVLSLVTASAQQTASATQFQYPSVPDSITALAGRADFFVKHFWDKANMKSVYSNKEAFRGSLNDFISLMPHAHSEVVNDAIAAMLDKIKKQPKDLEYTALQVQAMLYSDSAMFWSDEIFLPFAKAAATAKGVDAGVKERMKRIVSVLETNKKGAQAPALELTLAGGSKAPIFEPDSKATYQILFFNDPSCTDCLMARIKLNADYLVSRLIDAGIVKITSIYPFEADDHFRTEVAPRYPSTWTVGAAENADDVYDLRIQPCFYLLSGQGVILDKNMDLDDVLKIIERLRRIDLDKLGQQNADSASEELQNAE